MRLDELIDDVLALISASLDLGSARVAFALSCRRFLRYLDQKMKGPDLLPDIVTRGSVSQVAWALYELKCSPRWHRVFRVSKFLRDPPSREVVYYLKQRCDDDSISEIRQLRDFVRFWIGRHLTLEEALQYQHHFPSEGPLFDHLAISLLSGAVFQGLDDVVSSFLSLVQEIPQESFVTYAGSIASWCIPFDRVSTLKLIDAKMASNLDYLLERLRYFRIIDSIEGTSLVKEGLLLLEPSFPAEIFNTLKSLFFHCTNFEAFKVALIHLNQNLRFRAEVEPSLLKLLQEGLLSSPEPSERDLYLIRYYAKLIAPESIPRLFEGGSLSMTKQRLTLQTFDMLWKELLFPKVFEDPSRNHETMVALMKVLVESDRVWHQSIVSQLETRGISKSIFQS